MNTTTNNIKTTLNDINFINDINATLSKASAYKYGESELGERLSYFQSTIPVILNTIDEGIFDQLPETKRKTIWSVVNTIKTQLAAIKRYSYNSANNQVKNHLNQVINNINNFQDYIDQSNLILKTQGLQNYEEELKSLTKLKNRYKKYVDEIDEAKKILSTIQAKEAEALSSLKSLNQNFETGQTNLVEINNIKAAADLAIQAIAATKQKATDSEVSIKTKEGTINSLYKTSEDVQNKLSSYSSELTTFKSEKEVEFSEHKKKVEGENQAINQESKGYLKNIKELLQGATASRLYKAFNARKRQIEKELRYWLFGVIATNLVILIVSYTLIFGIDLSNFSISSRNNLSFGTSLMYLIPLIATNLLLFFSETIKNKPYAYKSAVIINIAYIILSFIFIRGISLESFNIEPMSSSPFDGTFVAKLLFIIPLALLDGFLIREYSFRKRLVEEYSYRAVLSMSLISYKEMIEKEENPNTIKFINETVEKIYSSPFEKNTISKKERSLLESLIDKGIDSAQSIAEKVIK